MEPTFKPSQVDLHGSFPPLCDTMKKGELECTAALMVRACQVNGDKWQPVYVKQLAELLTAKDPLVVSIISNPFLTPAYTDLVEKGYATFDGVDEAGLSFTEQGYTAMLKWVRQ